MITPSLIFIEVDFVVDKTSVAAATQIQSFSLCIARVLMFNFPFLSIFFTVEKSTTRHVGWDVTRCTAS